MAGNRDKNLEERQLIAATLNDLADSISELESRIEFMKEDLTARRERLAIWRRRLLQLNQVSSVERRRRPKGENFRAVLACLQGTITGLAASEIQRRTELAWSSIQATLKRHPDRFIEQNGLWRLNNATPPPGSTGPRRRVSLSELAAAQSVDEFFENDPEENDPEDDLEPEVEDDPEPVIEDDPEPEVDEEEPDEDE